MYKMRFLSDLQVILKGNLRYFARVVWTFQKVQGPPPLVDLEGPLEISKRSRSMGGVQVEGGVRCDKVTLVLRFLKVFFQGVRRAARAHGSRISWLCTK